MLRSSPLLAACVTSSSLCAASPAAPAAEQRVSSPGGKLVLVVSDDAGLRYRVELDGKPLLADSVLGLAFADGTTLGPSAKIAATQATNRNTTWGDPIGQRRTVPARTFALVDRAYDDGVAFRYDLPEASGLGAFTLNRELTEFRFPSDHRAWSGDESACAENAYRENKLSATPQQSPDKRRAGQPFRSVLPLLIETPAAYVAVAESDLLDWAGLFLAGTGETGVRAELAPREDKRGTVVGRVPILGGARTLTLRLQASGGYAAVIAPATRAADQRQG